MSWTVPELSRNVKKWRVADARLCENSHPPSVTVDPSSDEESLSVVWLI
jgi:hypothetical protein